LPFAFAFELPPEQIDAPIQLLNQLMHPRLIAADEIESQMVRGVHERILPSIPVPALIDNSIRKIDFVNPAQQRRRVLNVHHLELFYYVARAGGITPGLRLIPYGIQQPAVSSQLARLEESIGAKLFQRRPFSLTPAGRDVYEHIAPFFATVGQLAGRVRKEAEQHFRLAASASVLREQLPGLLKTIEQQAPGLRVTLREATQHSAERMLREHEIDLAVALLENKPGGGVRCEPLLKIPMVFLVEAASSWRTSAELLRAARRDPPPLIALPPREHLSLVFQKELARRKITWPTRIEASSLELTEAYVGHGFGIGLSLAVPGRVPPPGLRQLPLRGFPQLVFGALWSGRLPAPAASFLELARARAAELSGI
jgi:DNA-binding transcriptional LysR family regulator